MREYSAAHDPSLMVQQYDGGSSHLIVHYRLGDFVTNSWCIPPADLAAAAAALSPTIIELMDGGTKHLEQVKPTLTLALRLRLTARTVPLSQPDVHPPSLTSNLPV
jgi:hypothetical protein